MNKNSLKYVTLHKVEISCALSNDFTNLSSNIHPQGKADIEVSWRSLPQVGRKYYQITISLDEVLRHLLPERLKEGFDEIIFVKVTKDLFQFGLKIEFLLSPLNAFSKVLKTSAAFLRCAAKIDDPIHVSFSLQGFRNVFIKSVQHLKVSKLVFFLKEFLLIWQLVLISLSTKSSVEYL